MATMNANVFIAALKADNSPGDNTNLPNVFVEYKSLLSLLPSKDRAPFSLNVLCILCRNLDKAPKWRDSIDNKALLMLSIDCVRETRQMERADRVKTLACVYHIHRHIVKQNAPLPPELVMKISFMPFELEAKYLLAEYSKTYWNILVDRLSYIEKLRSKIHIVKLLPKLTEDILKIIEIYDTVQFCATVIIFIVKKLHFLYNEVHSNDLNRVFCEIFTKLSEKDTSQLKQCDSKQIFEIYIKLNECLYVIAENSSKTQFKDCSLDAIVRSCITIVGHRPDFLHCLQNFHMNTFCSILTEKSNLTYTETVLKNLSVSIETTEKLGYETAMKVTSPFLNQFLRLFIEYHVTNSKKKPWKDHFGLQIQAACLELMQKFMKNLKNCNQQLKCENCNIKTGLHDALRLSFQVKHFITGSLSQNIVITDLLPTILNVTTQQYQIMTELKTLGCMNYEKCFLKLQTDIHNMAISLNKASYLESSVKLFEIYLKNEFTAKNIERKNISRALYNKSICEMDAKLYEDALINAFLSLVFSSNLTSDKGMSLVIDIKAKEAKSKMDDVETDVQSCSVINACEIAMKRNMYGDLLPFMKDLKFSELLRHEFSMYAKLWPSLTPISGVWRGLLNLSRGLYGFIDPDYDLTWTLYEVILETPSVVRSMNLGGFNTVITEILDCFDDKSMSLDVKLVYSGLLLLKSEMELAAASHKYGWKLTEPLSSMDPDRVPANRTIPQEYAASTHAVRAVYILAEIRTYLHKVSNTVCLQYLLQIGQVALVQLLHLSRLEPALQLAVICCILADCVNDDAAYVRSVGTLLYHGVCIEDFITRASEKCAKLATERDSLDAAVTFMCDAAIYYHEAGSPGVAARLTQSAQVRILDAFEKHPDINLNLALGRLLEAQLQLCASYDVGPGSLSAAAAAQRHYLAITSTGSSWHTRRLTSLTTRHHCTAASLLSARLSHDLDQRRRGRAAVAAALPLAAAASRARLYGRVTDVNNFDDAQIKIDNRLKHVLGLQPSNETQPYYAATELKAPEHFTPKAEVETMLENLVIKKAISPSIPCLVPAFKVPDFFFHDHECSCYACDIPITCIIACQISSLEAAMYFKANENEVARNYFNGVVKMINLVEERLKNVERRIAVVYDGGIVDAVMKFYWEQFRDVQIEILIDLAFFEMKNKDFDVVDEHVVEIHEILKEMSKRNQYMTNNISNLMACSAQLRKTKKKPEETGLEVEFESLKLSPVKYSEPPKTPDNKPMKVKAATKIIVKDEELPKKRKVIKLNFNEDNDGDEFTKKPDFKIPVRVPTKHILEAATPKTRSKPKIMVTQPSEEVYTPNTKDTTEFFTPKETPDKFFTPLTSVKTYTKKSLRQNIVKNLELEFSTPHSSKENSKTIKNKDAKIKQTEEDIVTEKKELGRKEIGCNPKEKIKVTDELPTKSLDEESKELDNNVDKVVRNKDKQNLDVPSTSRSKVRDNKRTLKRATSPGKLCKEKELSRSRRLRKPVKFSIDEDDNR